MKSLKRKAIESFNWSVIEGISSQGITFIVGIILARILTPEDFGIVGLITVFILVSNSIIEGGLSSALIRKIEATEKDFNTIFYTNITLGLLIYFILYLASPLISKFFDAPILLDIIRVSTLVVIINSFAIVQRALLIKELNFKLQSIISLISSILAGTLAVLMAYNNFGVWSLVFLTLSKQLINCIFLWVTSTWKPSLIFSKSSYKEMSNYGYKLLIANLINTTYQSFYFIIIGKVFSPATLGYFTRADGFQKPFSSNIALGIGRISFPILSRIQDDNEQLKNKFRKFLKFSVLLSSIILFGIAGIAKPLVLILIGDKWLTSVFYLQLLCIPGVLYPLQILNINLLNVKGFSNLNLKLEIYKKVILIPILVMVTFFGINALLISLVVFSLIEFFINTKYTGKIINYSTKDQLKDISPFILIGISYFILATLVTFLSLNLVLTLIIQLLVALLFYFLILITCQVPEIKELRLTILKKMNLD